MVSLLAAQNPDGGWPYLRGGPSWTEPTAYALLALITQEPDAEVAEKVATGLRWLNRAQLSDGGWPPQPAVRQSSWVTAVAALLGPTALGEACHRRAIAWIVEQTGQESKFFSRVRQLLIGGSQGDPGWPWFPGASAWVTPTSVSMLALRKASRETGSPQIRARLDMGTAYLLAHACSDGGWNHGAARVLNRDAPSYPETTGVALLALHGIHAPAVLKACVRARAQLPECRSSEAESWLRLGLLAHGKLPPDTSPPVCTPRTIQTAALALLASAAMAGRNAFLE